MVNRILDDVTHALKVGTVILTIGLSSIGVFGIGAIYGMQQGQAIDRAMGSFSDTRSAPYTVNRVAPGYTIVSITNAIEAPSDYIEVFTILQEANLGDTVVFNITSPGGRVDAMIALAGEMHRSPAKVVANVIGPAYSAAAMITLAADEVRMTDGSLLMFHDVQVGGISGERGRIEEALVTYKKVVQEFIAEYNTKGILTQEEIDGLFVGNEVYLTKADVDARIKANKEEKERAVTQGNNG